MKVFERMRRLLDPIGGDIVDHPYRTLRLNLRRVELMGLLAIFNALVEIGFNYYRDINGFLVGASIVILCGGVLVLIARYGQKNDPSALAYLPEVFIVYALISSEAGGYLVAWQTGRIPLGYGTVFLACAVFFLVPPRRFALIGISTWALFFFWVMTLDVSGFNKASAIFNTAVSLMTGTLGRWLLDRMETNDRRQKALIFEQNAALVQANDRLTAHNAELNCLMAIAAHDLRSPLFGLRNLLDLAAQQPPSAAGLQKLFNEAGRSLADMLSLIGRLLEAHEAETQPVPDLQCYDLRKSLAGAVRRARATAKACGINLMIEKQERAVPARVDREGLDQILDNLLSNALRFSPLGSSIRLTAEMDGGPFLEVSDEGVGIPPEQRGLLFGKFQRGARRPLHGPRGSGLGLYIVRTLALRMGAKCTYKPGVAGGSTFRLVFPIDDAKHSGRA
ncbi:sensor histidine kinase (plasmid) [Nitrobacteraceae bacterium UC4446_H13]